MENYIDDSRIHQGHRERMRAKLAAHGQRIFDTYELLEMLLYHTIPYKDTNPIAKNLLYAFGSLDGVLSAPVDSLCSVKGVGERTAELISSVGALSDLIGAELVDENEGRFNDYESVGRFFTEYFRGVTEKQVIALYLDSGMRSVGFKKMYDLEYESGGVKAKPFIDEAMSRHAAVVITAHNHPYGPFYPTPGDRATNMLITEALGSSGIVHAEHYIICAENFAGIGSLKHFAAKLSQFPAVSKFIDTRERCLGAAHTSHTGDIPTVGGVERNNRDFDYFASLLSFAAEGEADRLVNILLDRYRTVEGSLTASVRELSSLVGERVALYLKLLAYVTSRRVTDGFAFGKKHSEAEIADYLKGLFLGESVEKIYLITCDSRERITGCELLGEGTVNASEVMPRKAIEAATAASASSVYIAHNHPFGRTEPSADDVNMSGVLSSLFATCEITLRGHFVVAGQDCDMIDF